jgi:hypothetical protein
MFTAEDLDNGRCDLCGRRPTAKGHDACIADLPGVDFACCGHRAGETGYVKFSDGRVIDGQFRHVAEMREVGPYRCPACGAAELRHCVGNRPYLPGCGWAPP